MAGKVGKISRGNTRHIGRGKAEERGAAPTRPIPALILPSSLTYRFTRVNTYTDLGGTAPCYCYRGVSACYTRRCVCRVVVVGRVGAISYRGLSLISVFGYLVIWLFGYPVSFQICFRPYINIFIFVGISSPASVWKAGCTWCLVVGG